MNLFAEKGCSDYFLLLGCGKEGVYVAAPNFAHVKDIWRMSSTYHNMIYLVFSIEIRRLPSRLVDIAVLDSATNSWTMTSRFSSGISMRRLAKKVSLITLLDSSASTRELRLTA